MRFISAQFIALLEGDLWLQNAKHANSMAKKLAEQVSSISAVKIVRPVEANGVFAKLSPSAIKTLQQEFDFHVWSEATHKVRWMMSFDTCEEDIDHFVKRLKTIRTGS